ncbi:MAG: glutamate-5-semialdehyde dehydrogenase, partial [Pseudomonadota bacterium]
MDSIGTKIESYVETLGVQAKDAARQLSTAATDQKNEALRAAAAVLQSSQDELLAANEADLAAARKEGRPEAFIDRLALSPARVEAIAQAVMAIANLPDPVGRVLHETTRPNGLKISRVAVPIGVIGMIYESRPNVGADAGALCVKSGNAVILRGGSDSVQSSKVIINAMRAGLGAAGLPENAIQYVDVRDRSAVTALLKCTDYVDLVIPRGGRGLVELVRDQASVPTLLHLDGNCHTYVHAVADIQTAVDVVANAKLRRTGVCGATESLVIDEAIAPVALPKIVDGLAGCEVRGDDRAVSIDPRVIPAGKEDWAKEYLDSIVSVRIVGDLDAALDFIAS